MIAIAIAWLCYRHWYAPIEQPPGVLIASEPEQEMLPENADAIEQACRSLRPGELIHLDGELVEASGQSMHGTWRSSLRRDDTGNGACELLLVEHVSKLEAEAVTAETRLVRR